MLGIMRYLLSILLLLLWTSSAACQEPVSRVNADPKLILWLKTNVSPKTGLPLSFHVSDTLKAATYEAIGPSDSLTAIIERLIIEEGVSIYDAALWQITLGTLGGSNSLRAASLPFNIYYAGHLKELKSIRAGYPNQPFISDPHDPEAVASDLTSLGKRGFLFRILNAHGKYNTSDPLDGKTKFKDFPTWPTVHWEDWKPIAGENAWVVIAAMHLYHKKYFDPRTSAYAHNSKALEIKLAEELARAALILQADNGGIRMAPMGTYNHLLNIDNNDTVPGIQKQLDAHALSRTLITPLEMFTESDFDFSTVSEEFKWHYFETSTENNLSWYTALRMLYTVTGKPVYRRAMDGIENYLKEVWSPVDGYFYQGMHFTNGAWIPNTEYFATDCQTWGLAKLGPAKIDEWFGEGSAHRMWARTSEMTGVFDDENRILGVGFTRENSRLSIEWTVGAIYAANELAQYYKVEHPEWSNLARRDAVSMRRGIENYRFELSPATAAYSYSSERNWIPFGWFSHEPHVISLVSTCWVALLDARFNPFFINGND